MSDRIAFKRKRPAPFSLRLTQAERDRIEAKAGAMPLGSYIKTVLLDEHAPTYRQRRKPPVEDRRLLAEILARLGSSRTANNLNQIAKHLNQGTLMIDEDLEADLKQACAEVAWMRLSLIKSLGLKPDGSDQGGTQ